MSSQSIRNVVLVGHNGNGKTTLAEAMLYRAGVVSRMGRVDDGTAQCDHDPEEKARHQSLSLSVASFDWREHRINIIDTPGYTDFVGEAVNGMHAADLAVFVVDAVSGVQAQDQVMWRHAERLGLPRLVFVNGLDRERSSFERTLESLQSHFGAHVEAAQLPLGAEASFHGIADLVGDGALDYSSGKSAAAAVPDDLADDASDGHIQLVEGVVEGDDELLEQYLEGTEPTEEQLERLIHDAVDNRSVFPVLCGSAAKPIGVDRLLDFICRVGPAPGESGPAEGVRRGEPVEVAVDASGSPVAVVFKTRIDDFLGQISLLKVLSGTIRANNTLVNSRTADKERLHNLMSFTGAEHQAVSQAVAGDIVAATKLGDVRTGDTLADDTALKVLITPPPTPVYGVAIHASAPAQEDKLASALRRFATEDPSLVIRQDATTRQTVLSGAGEAHLRVVRSRLERMGIDFEIEDMKIAYLETLPRPADVEAKHKKQSGGHGQFAVAMVRFEPLARGTGYEFDSEVTGGAIPRGLIPAVGAGIEEAMSNGGRHGFPMVDLRAVCYDGKHHSVDSSEMSFKIAGSLALKQAVEQVGSAVLEPVSEVHVEVPDTYQGDVLGDLNSRRGQVYGTEPGSAAGTSVIHAHVPTSEILSYVIDLRSMTGGTGTFSAAHHDYQPLPHALLAKVVADDD
ncbi:MAG: elongation factor G [Acidimicrobiaceae bacterium]|nr:elongation factor G [Acidimicrobiaceae bacterium]MDE0665622.1 elongation factor G [Acidimicrobiaceae bacterium]MXY11367.1 elongation factor G [Acidimicrobiaceae bacterium]MXZ64406.1 elongation factor G [Acidimicrobiaceae bacterium]MYE66172.1 elongation factor G [Acidimicrobiaceae bacterium]